MAQNPIHQRDLEHLPTASVIIGISNREPIELESVSSLS